MSFKHFSSLLLILVSLPLLVNAGRAGSPQDEKHLLVSLRMIGHELLLSTGDSTSRVLPIEMDSNSYRIRFDTTLSFNPEILVAITEKVAVASGLASGYIIEVESCDSAKIEYSYIAETVPGLDLAGHCRARTLPERCYSLLFTPTVGDKLTMRTGASNSISGKHMLIASLGILSLVLIIMLRKRRDKNMSNPNLISLGDYQFNKTRNELYIEQEKIELTSKESELLTMLVSAINTTIEREVILKGVWGDDGDYIGRTLDVFISKLRKKLEADPKVKIINIRGVGYKLVMGE